jgi:hypothetical protein
MKSINVPADQLDDTVRGYVRSGLSVTDRGDGWLVMRRPPVYRPAPSFWRAFKRTVLTVGIYPFAWFFWVTCLAWWVRPLQARRRMDAVTINVAN